MKIFTLLLSIFILFFASSQVLVAQHIDKCVAEIEFQEAAKKNPELLEIREQLERETAQWIAENEGKESNATYVIPVVFHVLHQCGSENISKAQIIDQMRILNEDYSRTNPDAVNTPLPFQQVAANCDIEFRLAQLDPQGNCTDGINRIYTPLTFDAEPRNTLKSAISWPRNQYLNVWVVGSIYNSTPGSITLGYAQFPGTGSATTDGIVLRSNYVGSIGTGGQSNDGGRTMTHEVGHWLNLRHIWGDAFCGNDFVSDTPTQEDDNSGCPNFPLISCNNGPNGDMYMNYMDYTNGQCQNILTIGQRNRMHAALNSSVSGRNNLWSTANLAATGVNQTSSLCAPEADFCQEPIRICEGESVTFEDMTTNGDVSTYSWSFPGGTPATSSAQNPQITYNTWGTYDVSLTATNATGSSSITRTAHVHVSRGAAWYSIPFSESFETIAFPGGFWETVNPGGSEWEQTTEAAVTGAKSVKLRNYTGNTQDPDEFITPSYNLSNVSQTMMTFELAFAARSSSSADRLQIFASTNCGRTWSLRYTKAGLALATAGLVSSNFIPTSPSQWREETVNLSSSSISGRDNVMFKFVYTNDTGNNIFIDDINITGVVGQEEILDQLIQLSIFPNPSDDLSTISFNLVESKEMMISITDVMGRTVEQVYSGELPSGDHSYTVGRGLSAGMYFVRLNIDGEEISKKLIRQ